MSDQSPGETFYMNAPAQGILLLTARRAGKLNLSSPLVLQTAVEGYRVWPDICMRVFGSGTDSYYGGNIHENFYGESGYDREKMVRS